ncbi:MAG: insulinase family protein [Oleiphilaceae bacterium]|nr:insulinase family protein [Oleiphilaceae bacterium]
MIYRTLLAFGTLFLLALSATSSAIELNFDIEKSPNDKREYASFTLENKLDVLIISDKEADKGAASLDIKVGSSHDPIEFPGLAHFLEHMLFLGTHKYPEPDAYQKFISEHGGGHNAYTSLEHTNYFFDVSAEYLEPALDRFSQQFTAPLFNADYVQREVNAVHSEYSSKIQDDGRRYLESFKAILNPDHPYKKFAVGNLETLVDKPDITLREALLEFYDMQYSANRMKLTVLGKEDLETLSSWVEEKFSSIANKNLPEHKTTTPFFSGGFLPAKIQVKSIKDTRSISLSFPIPTSRPYINTQPLGYIANLIGHEGKGSLLSSLKKKQLVDTLSAGPQFDTDNQGMFIISMSLTEKGLKQQDEVINAVFAYINLLKQNDLNEMYFTEQKQLSEIAFKFQEKVPALSYVRSLSSALHEFSAQDILSAPYKLNKFDKELISDYLHLLTPDNLLVSVKAKDLETDQETQWFKAPYSVKSLSVSLVNQLKKAEASKDLALPEPNNFIPSNTELSKAENNPIPVLLSAPKGMELWHATDTEFGTPKSTFFVSIRSPHAVDTVEHLVMTQLLVSMLTDKLVEFSYPAYLAGLSYDLYKHLRGVTLKIAGYNDKQDVLLETILKKIKHSELRDERFENIKERLKRSLENEKERKPFQQAITAIQDDILSPSWNSEEKLVALEKISIEQLREFKNLFFSTVDTAVLSNGNVEQDKTEKMAKLVEKHILEPAKIQSVERASVLNLEGEEDWAKALDIDHPDSSMVFYMQGETKSYSERALYSLMSQAIGNDYYAQLRTEKQLGYIVFATPYPLLEVPGIAFIVQSPSASTDQLFNETRTFLNAQVDRINSLSEEEFARYKKAVISRLEEKETNIGQRSNRYWSEIDKKAAKFDSEEQMINAIEAITIDNFRSFYTERVKKKGSNLIMVSKHQTSQDDAITQLQKLLNKKESAWLSLSNFDK